MGIDIEEADKNLLIEQVRRGEVVLILGAGANHGSLASNSMPLKDGRALSIELSALMGSTYSDEPLPDVCSAFVHSLGIEAFKRVLVREFTNTRPSSSLVGIFKYSWRRIYSWNIDDAALKATQRAVQNVMPFNGMADKVKDDRAITRLALVALHGQADAPGDEFIFSTQDYTRAVNSGRHAWYSQLVDDYRSHCPVFIGSSMNEPILLAELDRASETRGPAAGYAFLVTPDVLSDIRKKALEARGIKHLRGGVADFVDLLVTELGPKWAPDDVLSATTAFNKEELEHVTRKELAAAQFLRPISLVRASQGFAAKPAGERAVAARRFLTGFPASWEIAASKVPIHLSGAAGLKRAISDSIEAGAGLLVVTGPAGSGKSTAAMQAILAIEQELRIEVYELDADVPSISDIISVLTKISDKKKVIFVPVLYIFAHILTEHIAAARGRGILFVSTARSSEWAAHLSSDYLPISKEFGVERFGPKDFGELIDRLIEYVPAPRFIQLPRDQQVRRLQKSRGQLLVALREATESKNFDDIITDEFDKLPTGCTIDVFTLVGIATIARVGIRIETIVEALSSRYTVADVNDALNSLSGIVFSIHSGRLFVRHELYVRKIFDSRISHPQKLNNIISLVRTYTKYQLPVVRNVSRPDAVLFRFVLNRDFLSLQSSSAAEAEESRRVFEEFEVDFQLDGHFWLQYGMFVASLGHVDEGIQKLEKSLQAFPSNTYAQHALASLRLRYAAERSQYDSITRKLIEDAVGTLRELIPLQKLENDHYPLVTLALRHTGALIAHNRAPEAKAAGIAYLAEVQRVERTLSLPALAAVKECLLMYLAVGVWEAPKIRKADI